MGLNLSNVRVKEPKSLFKYLLMNTKGNRSLMEEAELLGDDLKTGVVLFNSSEDAAFVGCLHERLMSKTQHLLCLEMNPEVLTHAKDRDFARLSLTVML